MRSAATDPGTGRYSPTQQFEVPVGLARIERRLAGRAIDAWLAAGGEAADGFEANSLFVSDPAGRPTIVHAGRAISAIFGLEPGMALDGPGLAAEARAACDLIALRPEPVPFEATIAGPGRACILTRGVALPLGRDIEIVQVIVSWREVLNRAATARLRRELGEALRSTRIPGLRDPFLP